MASKKGFKSKLKFKSCKLKHFGAKASASALAIYAFDDGQKATTKWLIQEGNKIANTGTLKNFLPFHSATQMAGLLLMRDWGFLQNFSCKHFAFWSLMTLYTGTGNRCTFVICHGGYSCLNLYTKVQHNNKECKKFLQKT